MVVVVGTDVGIGLDDVVAVGVCCCWYLVVVEGVNVDWDVWVSLPIGEAYCCVM